MATNLNLIRKELNKAVTSIQADFSSQMDDLKAALIHEHGINPMKVGKRMDVGVKPY